MAGQAHTHRFIAVSTTVSPGRRCLSVCDTKCHRRSGHRCVGVTTVSRIRPRSSSISGSSRCRQQVLSVHSCTSAPRQASDWKRYTFLTRRTAGLASALGFSWSSTTSEQGGSCHHKARVKGGGGHRIRLDKTQPTMKAM